MAKRVANHDTKTDAEQREAAHAPAGGAAVLGAPALGLAVPDEQLDEAPQPAASGAAPAAVRGQQGDEGRPYCPRHNVLMRANGSRPEVTCYKCPVNGCEEKAKRVRPLLRVPAQPQLCPQRTCPEVALEVAPERSSVAQLHLACPQCGFALKVPRPAFEPQLARMRERAAADDLAAR